MNVISVVLFLHLAGAFALFIGYGIEWTASSLFRNAASVEQVRAWLRVFKVSPPLAGAGLGVLLLSGGYLASLSGAMRQGWMPTTFIGIFLALALGIWTDSSAHESNSRGASRWQRTSFRRIARQALRFRSTHRHPRSRAPRHRHRLSDGRQAAARF